MSVAVLEEMETKERFLADLEKHGGSISEACRHSQWDEAIVTVWMARDRVFADDVVSVQGRAIRRIACGLIRKHASEGRSMREIYQFAEKFNGQ